jgi:signal transduction histidine kinase
VIVEGRPRELTAVARSEAYRIAREAVCNAHQHAKARCIESEITFGNADLTIRVRDDGIGVDPGIHAHGLRSGHGEPPGVRERGGSLRGHLHVWGTGNAGTEVELRILARVAYLQATGFHFQPN